MENFFEKLSDKIWSWPLLLLFIFVGAFLTFRLRAVQIFGIGRAFRSISSKRNGSAVSSYSALCTALAATIGTGNIVGVATAIGTGGPGALFWMLLAAFLGMGTQFVEGFLAVRYGGGPYIYMEKGLRSKNFARIYAFITSMAGILGVGTITQMNSISVAVDQLFPGKPVCMGCSVWVLIFTGGVFILSSAVILGGSGRIAKVCSYLVPLMSGIFLFCSVFLVLRNLECLPYAVRLIMKGAFQPQAIMGAGAGIGVKEVLRMGVGRGVFTNEAGMGTAAIAAASSGETCPYTQGLISMSATFIDTLIICTLSGLSLIVTDVWNAPLMGGELTTYAWEIGLPWNGNLSEILLNLCLIFFAFATILGWGFYAEQCFCYLSKGRGLKLYRVLYLSALLVAPFFSVNGVFYLADILNGLMAMPNLVAVLLLHEEAVKEVRKKD